MNKKSVVTISCLVIIVILLILLPTALAQGPWPRSPFCGEDQKFYNNAFNNGLLGWGYDCPITEIELFGPAPCVQAIDEAPYVLRLRNGATMIQSFHLSPGKYIFSAGMILRTNSSIRPGSGIDDLLSWWGGECEEIDPGEWQGEHWGQIRLFWQGANLCVKNIPNGLPHDTYYQFEYPVVIGESLEGTGDFKVQLWSPAWCSYVHNVYTRIDLDWVSLCRVPPETVTPTVTGTPPDTPTATATSTVYCESTDYPTSTPYSTSTPYPTNTPWLTPPVLLTPTPYPTYTLWPTCVPTSPPTPYVSPTPFRFDVPITYTNSFDDLKDGVEDFVDSATALLDDISGMLITASTTVSDVTSFAITNTVVISGTPTAQTDMVDYFTSNMSGLSHLLGWFNWLRDVKPGVFWFILVCVAWTFLVYFLEFALKFFINVLWPLAKAIWDVVLDIWNAIPFI